MNTCETCRHFSALTGECRAQPPKAFLMPTPDGQVKVMGVWPATRKDNWCGGFVPIESRLKAA